VLALTDKLLGPCVVLLLTDNLLGLTLLIRLRVENDTLNDRLCSHVTRRLELSADTSDGRQVKNSLCFQQV
jgi:hypothetical protein